MWAYVAPMALAGLTILAPHYVGLEPKDRRPTPIEPDVLYALGTLAAFLIFIVAMIYANTYLALAAFALVYLKLLARQSWLVTGIGAVGLPLVAFLVFELALGLSLPKGFFAAG